MSTEPAGETHLTLRDAARRIGVHENTIRNWVSRGLLDPVTVAGSRYQRFRADDVDRLAHQQQISSQKARRAEGTTELVDADYLDSWASTEQARVLLPALVARLIEGSPGVAGVHVRTGVGVGLQGWDGLVENSPGSPWVPSGPSAWEIGTGGDPRRKASDDYLSRTSRPLEVEPSVTTFVFVTPRRWPAARQWERGRRAEGRWGDVRVLDADDLAGWLRSQPATHLWFSEEVGLQPLDVRTLDQWWSRYRQQTQPALPAELLLAGRAAAARRLVDGLTTSPPTVTFVRAASKEEATAFIAAALETSDNAPKHALIATSPQGWERLSLASQPSVLIPYIDDPYTATAVGMGHHVIVPLPAGTTPFRGEVIELGSLDRNIARDVLAQKASFSFDTADRLAALARRSLASFLRDPELAAAPRSRPSWAQGDRARLMASLVLAGAWSGRDADQRAVAQIAGKDWAMVEDNLIAFSDSSDPPFVRVGESWHVVSPDGAWTLLRHAAQVSDVERFCNKAVEILGEPDPALVLDLQERLLARFRGIRRSFSPALYGGVAQGLALLGTCIDDSFDLGHGRDDARYARLAVRRLLQRANEDSSGLLWRSISPCLRLLAEAAPDDFLDAVESGIAGNDPVLRTMFTTEHDFISETSWGHTELLWALELLCWAPAHIARAASALAGLAAIDPGARTANRPSDSLRAVFLPWMPQTSAPLSTRLEVLDRLRTRFPDVAWNLEMAIMPSGYDAATPTPRPRFQQWPTTDERVPVSEWLQAIAETTTRAVEDAGRRPQRWPDLVAYVPDLPSQQRDQVIAALRVLSPDALGDEPRTKLWEALVSLIAKHREFPEARWALSDDALQPLETITERLEPDDLVGRFAPYFDWDAPLPDVPREDYPARERAVTDARADAVRQILQSLGFPGIERLARASKLPEHVGVSAAEVSGGEYFPEIRGLLGHTGALGRLAHGWVASMAADRKWLDAQTAEMADWPDVTQIGFLLALGIPSARIVSVVDSLDPGVQRQYWERVRPIKVDDDALTDVVDRLLAHARPWTAIHLLALVGHRPDRELSPAPSVSQIVTVLDAALSSESADPRVASNAAYDIGRLLDYLQTSGGPETTLARFEWSFFRVLEHTRPSRSLYRVLAADPDFFVELVSHVYRAKKAPPPSAESDERVVAIAQNAWSVLRVWRPRLNQPDGIPGSRLRSWVGRARTELATRDRGDIGDHQIGQTLSGMAPEADGIWPPKCVRDLIEELNSTNLESGLAIGAFNARGVTTRGMYDGGAQEWALAAKYRGWAEAVIGRWPRTGRMLMQLADDYEREARREDLEAHALASDLSSDF